MDPASDASATAARPMTRVESHAQERGSVAQRLEFRSGSCCGKRSAQRHRRYCPNASQVPGTTPCTEPRGPPFTRCRGDRAVRLRLERKSPRARRDRYKSAAFQGTQEVHAAPCLTNPGNRPAGNIPRTGESAASATPRQWPVVLQIRTGHWIHDGRDCTSQHPTSIVFESIACSVGGLICPEGRNRCDGSPNEIYASASVNDRSGRWPQTMR